MHLSLSVTLSNTNLQKYVLISLKMGNMVKEIFRGFQFFFDSLKSLKYRKLASCNEKEG
jgi:hypothetical protein